MAAPRYDKARSGRIAFGSARFYEHKTWALKKDKVKFTLEQARKVPRGSAGIAVLFL
jgi:hypothetical protein